MKSPFAFGSTLIFASSRHLTSAALLEVLIGILTRETTTIIILNTSIILCCCCCCCTNTLPLSPSWPVCSVHQLLGLLTGWHVINEALHSSLAAAVQRQAKVGQVKVLLLLAAVLPSLECVLFLLLLAVVDRPNWLCQNRTEPDWGGLENSALRLYRRRRRRRELSLL